MSLQYELSISHEEAAERLARAVEPEGMSWLARFKAPGLRGKVERCTPEGCEFMVYWHAPGFANNFRACLNGALRPYGRGCALSGDFGLRFVVNVGMCLYMAVALAMSGLMLYAAVFHMGHFFVHPVLAVLLPLLFPIFSIVIMRVGKVISARKRARIWRALEDVFQDVMLSKTDS